LVPKEVFAIVGGVNERMKREQQAWQAQNHALAVLISFAYHDPGKMPAPPGGATKEPETSSAADDARVRGFFIAMSMRNAK
tara:strand:+ start:996 stop:1238 length:243 start_codon:yes stop_codon:yes gene_type:complete